MGRCIWPHRESVCDVKGYSYLQMYFDTGRRIFVQVSPQCGSACDRKGLLYLQMSLDTHNKKIAETSSIIKSSSVYRPSPIDVKHFEKNWITWPLLLSPVFELRNSFPFLAAPLVLCKPYIFWKLIMLATSTALFWPSTTEYLPVPPSTDPVFNNLMV